MNKRRAEIALFSIFILAYLGFLLYFLTIQPAVTGGNPAVILALTAFASGGMMFMAIFAVMLYLFRRGEKTALYFALMCVSAGVRFFFMEGSKTIMELVPGFSHNAIYAVRYMAIGLFIVGITGFIYEFYMPAKKFRKAYTALRVITVIAYMLHAILSAIQGGDNVYTRMFVVIPTISIQLYGLFLIVNSPAFKANRLNQFYFATIVAYMAEAVLLGLFLDRFPNVAVITQTFFVIVHTILLSDRYSRAISENELLDKLNRTKTEFLQDMSHEMKSPLTVIATGIDFADREIGRDGGDLAEARSALDIVREETQRLGRMVSGMISLAAMSGISDNRKRVDFAALLGSSAEAFRLPIEKYNNALRVKIAPGLPDVFVEHDRFIQVMANLLANAADHTQDGQVFVTAEHDGSVITVQVSDTGDGIELELLPAVFERGVSGRSGTGYGLYICKTVVEAHGGTIKIESEPGKGTAVTFTVPVYGGQEAGHRL